MRFSDIKVLCDDYDVALWSPSRMHVKFGCDCGCGGSSYTVESWDKEEDEANAALERAKKFCEEYNIEYDGELE